MLGLVGPVVAAHSAKRSSQSHVHSSAAQTQLILKKSMSYPLKGDHSYVRLGVRILCLSHNLLKEDAVREGI